MAHITELIHEDQITREEAPFTLKVLEALRMLIEGRPDYQVHVDVKMQAIMSKFGLSYELGKLSEEERLQIYQQLQFGRHGVFVTLPA